MIAEGIRKITKSDTLFVYEEPEPTRIDRLLRYKKCVLPSDLSFPEDHNYGRINYVYQWNSETYRLIITDVFEEENKQESTLAKQIWLEDALRTKYKGLWVRVNKDQFIELILMDDAQAILKKINEYAVFAETFSVEEYFGKGSQWKFLVFTNEYPKLPFLLEYNSEKQTISKYGTYILDINQLATRMPNKDNYEFLRKKKVSIIGCGSGGSKDAEYLVKSGVGRIVLIDDDTLQTENILRHSCQLDDLSIEKVYAVKNMLRKINPFVDVQTLRQNLDVIDTKTDELIRDSDLIIVATASNEELFNEYAFSRGIPAIYSKVYPMGFGGEIIRIIPGLTPCWRYSCLKHRPVTGSTFCAVTWLPTPSNSICTTKSHCLPEPTCLCRLVPGLKVFIQENLLRCPPRNQKTSRFRAIVRKPCSWVCVTLTIRWILDHWRPSRGPTTPT